MLTKERASLQFGLQTMGFEGVWTAVTGRRHFADLMRYWPANGLASWVHSDSSFGWGPATSHQDSRARSGSTSGLRFTQLFGAVAAVRRD